MADDDDLEEAEVITLYAFDCPYCGGQTPLGDVQETGRWECVDCHEYVMLV